MYVPDAVRRGVRSFVQAFIGTLLSTWIGQNFAPGALPPLDVARRIVTAAAVAGIIALLTYIQNALEDSGAIPSFGKAPASVGANPVPPASPRIEPH